MKSAYLGGILALVIGLLGLGSIVFILVDTGSETPVDLDPNIEIVIIAGELGNNFGFKTDTESVITSPGVEINLKEGDIVRIIFLNEGEVPHSFAITGQPESTALTLFKSDIGGPSSPIQPGATSETIIILDKPGTYYYVCTVPGHTTLGMYGTLIVESI